MASFVNGIAVVAEGARGTTGEYREIRPSEQDPISSRERDKRDKSAFSTRFESIGYEKKKNRTQAIRDSSFFNNSTVKRWKPWRLRRIAGLKGESWGIVTKP